MNDVLALLADANPVRVEDLTPPELPDLTRRPMPRRRLVAVAALATAVAASLIGAFLIGGTSHHRTAGPRPRTQGGFGPTGPPGPISGFSVKHPIYSPQVSPAAAASAIGVPVVLPDTALVRPRDAGPMFAWSHDVRAIVAVSFPAKALVVEYERPSPWADPRNGGLIGFSRNFSGSRMTRLDGHPALVIPRKDDNTDRPGHRFGYVIFDLNGLKVTLIGQYGEAALEAIARSIVDRTPQWTKNPPGPNLVPIEPPRKRVSVARALRIFGAPIPLPAPLIKRSAPPRVLAVGKCPASRRSWPCMIVFSFPAESIFITYERPQPTWPRTTRQYKLQAKHVRGSRFVEIYGVPGWEVPENIDHHNAGFIEFAVGGSLVRVSGYRNTSSLKAIARSIVHRARVER